MESIIEWLRNLQKRLPTDYALHFSVCYILMHLLVETTKSYTIALVVTAVIGLLKEFLVDKEASVGDLVADGLGIIAASFVMSL